MTAPPRAGPSTAATCHPLLFQVTAFGRSSIGTICGNNAHRAGALRARAQPARIRQGYVRETGPWMIDRAASPADARAARNRAETYSAFRLRWSAACPAGIDRSEEHTSEL